MSRKQTIAWGVALIASIAGPAIADGPPVPGSYPMAPSAALPSSQGGVPGSAGSNFPGMAGGPSVGGMGEPITNPNGSPTDEAGSGAFTGAAGPDSAGGGGAGTSGAGTAGAGAGGFSPGLGGFAGGSGAPPGIIGDLQPISRVRIISSNAVAPASRFPNLPSPIPPPHVSNGNPGLPGLGSRAILANLTGAVIADNQSPIPQDRFFYSFNYFDNINNGAIDSNGHKVQSPISNLQVYHQIFGLEKTFFDGRASLGFRVPLNTFSLRSSINVPGLGGSSTAPGNTTFFAKYILHQREGFALTTGLSVTPPTGPGAFAGNKFYSYFRDTQIQPFVGYLFTRDRFYLQGFSSISVPTMSQDVTLLFNDVSIGYYVYRPSEPNKFLTAIVPTAEAHLTTPLNHRGFNVNDFASIPDVLNMTFGTNVEFRRRAIVSVAYVTPVTGPKPFNAELVLLLNVRFGGPNRYRSALTPPIL